MALTLNGSTGISGVDGSAATPALQGGDANTGISFGTDVVITNTGGVERSRVDSSGRLLVGTSTARANYFNASDTTQIQVEGTTYSNSSISAVANVAGTSGPILVFGHSRGTTVGSNTILNSGDEAGRISFLGNDGSEFVEAAFISALVDGTPGSNDMPGRLVFSTTADGASSPTEAARINSSGNFLIGVTSSSADCRTHIYKTATGGDVLRVQNASGSTGVSYIGFRYGTSTGTETGYISTNGTSTTYNTSSDYRLKENIVDLDGAINRLKQLRARRFNFIADPGTLVDGFIAHEAQEVVPECVTGVKDQVDDEGNPKYQGIDQSKLVPLLTAALQEAIGEIESLKARVAALESA